MSDVNNPLEWVSYAEDDFVAAKALLRRKKPLVPASCFHSQQCAEKYLKALLIAKNVVFPKTHDLIILDTLCNRAGILTGFTKDDLGYLSGHAVQSRYPGDAPILEDAQDAIKLATTIRRFARTYLGLKR